MGAFALPSQPSAISELIGFFRPILVKKLTSKRTADS
jgi:hypothetical protein